MRRLVALLAAVAALGVSLVWASAAGADPLIPLPIPIIGNTSCKSSPTPATPGTGTPAIFDGQPSGGTVSNYDRYGYGPHWATYDLGCAGVAGDPMAVIDTGIGGILYGFATDLVALGNGLHHLVAPPTFLSAFDRLETSGTQAIYTHLFLVFLPISLLILGLLILFRARHQDLARVVKQVGWAVFAIFLAVWAFSGPVQLGRLADSVEVGSVSAINGALAGQQAGKDPVADLEVDSVLRPMWLQGELGTSTGPVVDQFGQKLWDAQALTWDEAAGKKVGDVSSAKEKQFADLASQVHDQQPAAYDQLKGDAIPNRIMAGGFALGGALLTVPFRMFADLMLVASLLLLRILVVFLPFLAVIGLHDRMASVLHGALHVTMAAIINAVVFAAAAALNTFGDGVLLSGGTGLPQWVGLLLCGVLMVVLWVASKPFRKLTKLVAGGFNPVRAVPAEMGGMARHGMEAAGELAMVAATGSTSAARAVERSVRQRRESIGDEEPMPAAEPTTPPVPAAEPVLTVVPRVEAEAPAVAEVETPAPAVEPEHVDHELPDDFVPPREDRQPFAQGPEVESVEPAVSENDPLEPGPIPEPEPIEEVA